jgi:hypothetical protein
MRNRIRANIVPILLAAILLALIVPGLLRGMTFVSNCSRYNGGDVADCVNAYVFGRVVQS